MNTKRNPVGWFELYVQDMERAKNFYQATLKVTLEHLQSPPGIPIELWAFPMEQDVPGCAGALVKMEGVSSGGGGTIIYFSCADCAEETARAVANGGQIHKDKFAIGDYGFCSLVVDTEGNMIGLHSMK
jgi:predicted enzyme related to lactoylglutathione lyase